MSEKIRQIDSSEFPLLLNEISDPPQKLFTRGALPHKNNILLAVVGSRKYTPYGKSVCEHLISNLRGYPITIVSGLALGIDALSHQCALKADLQTIAIPGSGLNDRVLYPASNVSLAHSIINSGGGLLSEYNPDFKATVWSFPKRNRIMAGMSHATLIIEATEKSGTLITARLAMEYNRDVLAVPGSIFSPASTGPHKLIADGATPISNINDLLSALPIKISSERRTQTFENCTEHEKIILKNLNEPQTRDEIISKTQLSSQEINIAITLLEMKTYIKEQSGKIHRA